jgi:hypothetical protein
MGRKRAWNVGQLRVAVYHARPDALPPDAVNPPEYVHFPHRDSRLAGGIRGSLHD